MTRSNLFTAFLSATSLLVLGSWSQGDEPSDLTGGKKAQIVLGGRGPAGNPINSAKGDPTPAGDPDKAQMVLGGKGSAGKDQNKSAKDEAAPVEDNKKPADQPALRTLTQKRQWLRQQAALGVQDKRQVQQLQARIDHLTPQQVDALMNGVLAQQLPQDQQQQLVQQAQLDLYRARLLQQALANEWWWRNNGGAVGYMPMITWLPEGTSFGAGAVISPDGRYVRVTPSPFFSSVGPVYTYNLGNGETQPWPPYGYPYYDGTYPYYGGGSPAYPRRAIGAQPGQMPPRPSATPKVWHDGIRTRVGP